MAMFDAQVSKLSQARLPQAATWLECPSCSLIVKVIYNLEDFQPEEEESQAAVAAPQKVEN